MKIGFDAKRALNNATGLGNHARILLNALMRDFPEHEYHLFSPKAQDEFFHQLHGNFKLHFPETKFQKAFHSLWRSFGIKSSLLNKRIDVYHGLSNEIPFGRLLPGIRKVVTIHDLIFLKHKAQYPFFDRQIYELKTRYAAKHADHIIAVSQETKRDLIEFYKVPEKKITVIYPSVDTAFQAPVIGHRSSIVTQKYNLPREYILNVGSFFPRKNQQTLIEAFDRIKDKIEEDLVLAGNSGSNRKEIEQLIADKNLQQRVRIVSNISNEDLPSVYQAASVFVFPSLFEGFGAPVLEALFSKIPVITTKDNAIEEAAGKSSLLVNPLSAEDIAEKILLVLKYENLRSKMVAEGYVHAQTMTDKIFAEKVMRVYKALE
ncbi:MAG: glycosyltransferase family 4 protein [Chitinophagales bacterium]|nr:glycosyltransferase family 4 protein [Chitinophagales bacterium]